MTDVNIAAEQLQVLVSVNAAVIVGTEHSEILVSKDADVLVGSQNSQVLVSEEVDALIGSESVSVLVKQKPWNDIAGPLWTEAINGEPLWEPGLVYNGCEFVRYHIWDGQCWQASSSSPVAQPRDVFPTRVSVYIWEDNGVGASMTIPAFPVDMTSAVALVGLASHTVITPPAGWTVLGETSVPNPPTSGTSHIRRAMACAIDNPTGTEGTTFTFSSPMSDSYNGGCYAVAYFTGGTTGGTWSAQKGVEVQASYSNFPPITITDGEPNLWWQAGIVTAVYTSFVAPPGVIGSSNGFVTSWAYPTSASGSTFQSVYLDGLPYTSPPDIVDTNNIGAYGQPKSTSYGFKWTPPAVC